MSTAASSNAWALRTRPATPSKTRTRKWRSAGASVENTAMGRAGARARGFHVQRCTRSTQQRANNGSYARTKLSDRSATRSALLTSDGAAVRALSDAAVAIWVWRARLLLLVDCRVVITAHALAVCVAAACAFVRASIQQSNNLRNRSVCI